MQFDFKLTPSENRQSLQLNQTGYLSRWRGFVIVAISLLPSLVVFWFLDASISLLAFGVMLVAMLAYAAHAAVMKVGMPEAYDQSLTLSENELRIKYSHSDVEIKWANVDAIEETQTQFRFKRLARYWLLPKRVLGDQVDACRALFERVRDQPLDDSAVDLYSELFESESPFPIYRFRYDADDLKLAIKNPFVSVDDPNQQVSGRIKFPFFVWMFLLGLLAIYLTSELLPGSLQRADYFGVQAAAWVLPGVLLWSYSKLASLWRKNPKQNQVPDQVNELRLTENGWAIGDRHGVAINDWRDVSGIFHNEDFFGFRMITQLLNIVPKRAFGDLAEANRFLAQAIDLRRRAGNRDDIPTAALVETGNPYQSPQRS